VCPRSNKKQFRDVVSLFLHAGVRLPDPLRESARQRARRFSAWRAVERVRRWKRERDRDGSAVWWARALRSAGVRRVITSSNSNNSNCSMHETTFKFIRCSVAKIIQFVVAQCSQLMLCAIAWDWLELTLTITPDRNTIYDYLNALSEMLARRLPKRFWICPRDSSVASRFPG